jgi:antitoxin (DNA-binding transcriptional repressor) of toxin-antitoxin stability system
MREAKISQVKNQLSRYLALVKKGETIRILDRDRPVAQIIPIATPVSGSASDDALVELERKGIVRRGKGKLPKRILKRIPAGKPAGAARALIEERRKR